MIGFPNPSHVDGKTTTSHAAYASTTRSARPSVTGISARSMMRASVSW
jgi:hypothetical protein